MPCYVLDASTLVNLLCGWGGLAELSSIGGSWKIGNAALGEVQYVREHAANGAIERKPLTATAIVAEGSLQELSLDSEAENQSFINFATELDDGEAQALALALHRGCVLVTDDRPAARVARDLDKPVVTMGTPEVLIAWAGSDPEKLRRLPEVVRRIAVLGPFQLKRGAPQYEWWQKQLETA